MKIIAVANQKGGVGKTTSSICLSSSLSSLGKRVLLIDCDPQGNASAGLGIDSLNLSKTLYNVFLNETDINKAIKKTSMPNLEIVPSNINLASIEAGATSYSYQPQFLLKNNIDKLTKTYDYIILDCPPSLGFLSINALAAADSVLIPVQCEYFALNAVAQILATIKRIKSLYNSKLDIEGFLLTMYDPRTKLCVEIGSQIRGLFKENTFITTIPRNISLPEAQAQGIPVTIFRPTSAGSLSYLALAREVLENGETR
ncbi:MAG: ParA family protein [Bacilli bacterium]